MVEIASLQKHTGFLYNKNNQFAKDFRLPIKINKKLSGNGMSILIFETTTYE